MGTGNVFSTYDPTALFAGLYPVRDRTITLAGSLNASGVPLPRGTLLGRSSIGAVTHAATGGNTGNGTLTPDATTPALANAQVGAYKVTFTTATAFTVTDPNGDVVGTGVNGAAFDAQIKFVTAAGGTPFVAGDSFTVTVASADSYTVSKSTSIDGSQNPVAILAADTDTSGGSVTTIAYFEGEFAFEKMNVDASWSFTTLDAALRKALSSLFVRSVGTLG